MYNFGHPTINKKGGVVMPDFVAIICLFLIIISTFCLYGYSNSKKRGLVLFAYIIITPVLIYDYYIFITRYIFSDLIVGFVHFAIFLFLLLINTFVIRKIKYIYRPLYIMLFYVGSPLFTVLIYKVFNFALWYFGLSTNPLNF